LIGFLLLGFSRSLFSFRFAVIWFGAIANHAFERTDFKGGAFLATNGNGNGA
jgi:hypothetical protein